VFIDAFAGASGGVIAQLLFYPLENFRTRLQADTASQASKDSDKSPEKRKRIGILKAFRKMIKEEGMLSFYKGLKMALIGTIVSSGCYFFGYRLFKNMVTHKLGVKESEMTSRHIMLVTGLAGLASSIGTNPFWLVNTRMTLAKEKKSVSATIRDIYKDGGIAEFYKGVLPNLILVINPIINFVLYEAIKKFLLKKSGEKSAGALKIFIASSIGKIAATFATYPILTVRVKLQASSKDN